MNKCPNSTYKGIECPYALSPDSPLPCFGEQEQCDEWRAQLKAKTEPPKKAPEKKEPAASRWDEI